MFMKCPNCSENTISPFEKWRASEYSPAICSNCGCYSATNGSAKASIAVIYQLLSLLVIYAGLLAGGLKLGILGLLVFIVVIEIAKYRFLKLRVLSQQQVSKSKLNHWAILGFVLFIIGLSVLHEAGII